MDKFTSLPPVGSLVADTPPAPLAARKPRNPRLIIALSSLLLGMMLLAAMAGMALYEQARQIGALARTDSAILQNTWPRTIMQFNRLVRDVYKLRNDPRPRTEEFFHSLESLLDALPSIVQAAEAQFPPGHIPNIDGLRALLTDWSARVQSIRTPAAAHQVAQDIAAQIDQLYAETDGLRQEIIAAQTAVRQRQRDGLLKGMQRVQWTLGGLAAGSFTLAIWLLVLTRQVSHYHHRLAQANEQLETAVAQRTQQLVWLANTDPLTGLKNRRAFTEAAQAQILQCRRYPHPLAALIIDIDHFKSINDRFGHHVGDQALQRVTEAIVQTLRVSDIIGRLGGEEFAVLMPHTDAEAAHISAERVRQAVESMKIGILNAEPLRLTVSLGIALFEPELTLDLLLMRADTALYRAKNNGRNRVEAFESLGENSQA